MSRGRGDQRGKRTGNAIKGHDCFDVVNDRLITRCGGEDAGTPEQKKMAKRTARRLRRREPIHTES